MEKDRIQTVKPHVIIGILIISATFAVYAGTLRQKFLLNWDDIYYVVNNATIRGFTWEHLREAFTTFYVANYAPLHIVSYMFDYTLWGLNPAGFLFTNVLLH